MNQTGNLQNVPSLKLKSQIIDQCYNGATLLEGYRYLAGIHPTTGGGIFVVDGIQDRAVYKAMVAEAQQAGIERKKLTVYGYLQTYSGPSLLFIKLDDLGLPDLDHRMMSDTQASNASGCEASSSDLPAFATDLDQQYRYQVEVSSELVRFLPKTDFRPEPMRVTRRASSEAVWFEVETYNERMERWIQQKDHSTAELALEDAIGWNPDPAANASANTARPAYTQGQLFDFKPGDSIIGNGFPGTVVRMYSKGMVEVRLPGGIACIPASYPDCYPA